MLKIGTVFSGIGAIEHALKRMSIPHKIVFACDNGDVDIFKIKMNYNIIEILEELELLSNTIKNLNISVDEDYSYMADLDNHIKKIKEKIDIMDKSTSDSSINQIISEFSTNFDEYIIDKVKEYVNKFDEVNDTTNTLRRNKKVDQILFISNVGNELSKELKKDKNSEYKDIEIWFKKYKESKVYKEIRKEVSYIIDEIQMLHQKIETLKVLSDLSKINDYKEKKKYVDNLYKGKESSNFVKKSYLANYDIDEEDFHWNVSFLDATQYKDKVDLVVGGSPCQAFSLVGKRRGLEDTRGTLFYEFARTVKESQPKVFIYENVRALLSHDEGRTWETIKAVFNDLNYDFKFTTLNARDYGIPQNRERIFVVGFRKDLVLDRPFEFPKPIELNRTMKDFLIDNVSGKYYLNKKGVDFVTSDKNISKRYTQIDGEIQLCQKKNQQFNWHGDFVFVEENKEKEKTIQDLEKYFLSEKVEKYVLSSGTKGFYSKPEIDLDIARPLVKTMHKMHRAGVDNYVTTAGRIRKLIPRECLRLMGFCDSFKIVVSDTQVYQQAGNSIVVDVLINIMNSIIKSLPQIIEGEGYNYKEVKNCINKK
ncbi:MAG: DNA cytosine methyltransferase [Terrisporobacter sp.]|uniref:DNA cytosine methyltransferase n=1 Tax=Terrisporobacter sp. TaxID=1965305 RepID=UPI0039948E9E